MQSGGWLLRSRVVALSPEAGGEGACPPRLPPVCPPARPPARSWPSADTAVCRARRAQAGAGLVADSVPESEYEETVNKSAALGRAIDLAEQAFVAADGRGST